MKRKKKGKLGVLEKNSIKSIEQRGWNQDPLAFLILFILFLACCEFGSGYEEENRTGEQCEQFCGVENVLAEIKLNSESLMSS